MPSKAISLDLSEIEFEQTGTVEDPGARLLATVTLGGTDHHLEAIAVADDASGCQNAVAPMFETFLGELHEAFGPDSAFQTVHIKDRDYAVFLSPYCT